MYSSYTDGEKAIGTTFKKEDLAVMSKIVCVFTLYSAIVHLGIDLKDILIKIAKDDATSLYHCHSIARSEPRLRPTPQLTAMRDP